MILGDLVISNQESSIFAANSKYLAPIYGFNETNNKKLESFLDKYHDSHTDAYLTFDGIYLYDSVWLAALTKIQSNNTKDIEILNRDFINISFSYTGITGQTILNDFGDRLYGIYDFWTVVEKKENNINRLEWTKVNQ
jgi:hypothetical protein